MARGQLILIFLLQFAAGISGDRDLYYILGNDVILPCDDGPSSETRCSHITWLHDKITFSRHTAPVNKGNIDKNLPGADRLSLSRNCSLIINNITAEDAGRYTCHTMRTIQPAVHLNILTISPSLLDADPKTDDEVTLKCSLLRYHGFGPCPLNSVRWVDENGTVLLGEGIGFKFNGQTGCDSLLTVKHQSGCNRRYTCQFTERNTVKIEVHCTPVSKAGKRRTTEVTRDDNNNDNNNNNNDNDNDNNNTIIIIVGIVVGMLVVLVVIAAVLIKCRRRAKVTEDVKKPAEAQDEPGGNLTYVTVNHANHNPKRKVRAKEEPVTYSTVMTSVKMEADSDPSSFYSSIR